MSSSLTSRPHKFQIYSLAHLECHYKFITQTDHQKVGALVTLRLVYLRLVTLNISDDPEVTDSEQ